MDPTHSMILPGLSVWLWGPIMWTILHTIASISDRSESEPNIDLLINFYTSVQVILPCRYCRDSYGPMLQLSILQTSKSFSEIINSRQLSLLIYSVHNKVNDKLAKQRWDEVKGILKSRLPTSVHDILECEDTESQLLSVLDKRPSTLAVFKRDIVYQHEPINLYAVHLLCILFSRRASVDPTLVRSFRIFLNTICIYFSNIDNISIKTWCKTLLQAIRSNSESVTAELEKIYFNFYPSEQSSLEEKLKLFNSSGCGAGTCK